MAEQNTQKVNLVVPVAIVALWAVAGICSNFGWNDTTWTSAPISIIAAKVFSIIFALAALFFTIGYFGSRAGYTKPELEKWGDDAMKGKPPI
jgi:hypothetical protein